jgi:hypothetical protein
VSTRTTALGFAVDNTVELLSGYVPGEVDHHDQWRWPRSYRSYAELLGRGGELATVADAHQRSWTSVVEAVPDGAALVLGHGEPTERVTPRSPLTPSRPAARPRS